jgi:hypothetical protein
MLFTISSPPQALDCCPDMSGQQSKACGAYNFSFAGADPTFIDQNLCHTGLLE